MDPTSRRRGVRPHAAPPAASPARATIAHYDRHAEEYRAAMLGHAIPENIRAFLAALPRARGCDVLDLGCGTGRDLEAFRAAGHRPVGLDGSEASAAFAREHSGCPVWVQDFLDLDLPQGAFDGVFANASLFHVPSGRMPDVLARISAALRPGGALFANNPIGDGEEGWADDRWMCLWSPRRWGAVMRAAGFERLRQFRRPPGLPRAEQLWLATLWRKQG
jgi:SAM-dependent methyltransferase